MEINYGHGGFGGWNLEWIVLDERDRECEFLVAENANPHLHSFLPQFQFVVEVLLFTPLEKTKTFDWARAGLKASTLHQ